MSEPSPRPAIASSPISVILFARALATDTDEALQGWRRYLDTLNRSYEILLVRETRPEVADDASAMPEATKRMHPISYERSAGFRDALNEAIRTAQYPLIAFATCDKQYQPADLGAMLKMIDQVDLVVGYRKGETPPPWRVLLDMILIIASRVFIGVPLGPRVSWLGSEGRGRRWAARWIFGLRVLDPECPFRLARREIFQRIPIQSRGPFVQVEMLAKANQLSCLIAEELVSWTPQASPLDDAIPFGDDAWRVFRDPDFGPPSLAPVESTPSPTPATPVPQTSVDNAGNHS